MVELALIAPFVFLLIALVADFTGLINSWIAVANATRAAGDYAILSGSSAGYPVTATSSSLQSLINADLGALPNLSSTNPNACVQLNDNGAFTTLMEMPSGACANYAWQSGDNEIEQIGSGGSGTYYANIAVDITYTYTAPFLGSKFLGYAFPTIPTSVHQHAVMRLQ